MILDILVHLGVNKPTVVLPYLLEYFWLVYRRCIYAALLGPVDIWEKHQYIGLLTAKSGLNR